MTRRRENPWYSSGDHVMDRFADGHVRFFHLPPVRQGPREIVARVAAGKVG